MVAVIGQLEDFGSQLDKSTKPRILFIPSGPAVSNTRTFFGKPIIVDHFSGTNTWTADLVPTDNLTGIDGEDVFYRVRIERQVSGADYMPWDDTEWKLYVPDAGGEFSKLVRARTNPAQIHIGPAVAAAEGTPGWDRPATLRGDPNRFTGWIKTNALPGEPNYFEWE